MEYIAYRGSGMKGIPVERNPPPPKKVLVGTRRAMLHHAKNILTASYSLFYITENRS